MLKRKTENIWNEIEQYGLKDELVEEGIYLSYAWMLLSVVYTYKGIKENNEELLDSGKKASELSVRLYSVVEKIQKRKGIP